MDKVNGNLNNGRRTKKTQKEVNQTFRDKHRLIQVPFKKESDSDKQSTPSEYDVLINNASNYTKSLARFIRDCALEPRIKVIEKRPLVNEKMLLEIHKIGVNINQMAYKINAKVDAKELLEFKKTLDELSIMLTNILEVIRSK